MLYNLRIHLVPLIAHNGILIQINYFSVVNLPKSDSDLRLQLRHANHGVNPSYAGTNLHPTPVTIIDIKLDKNRFEWVIVIIIINDDLTGDLPVAEGAVVIAAVHVAVAFVVAVVIAVAVEASGYVVAAVDSYRHGMYDGGLVTARYDILILLHRNNSIKSEYLYKDTNDYRTQAALGWYMAA